MRNAKIFMAAAAGFLCAVAAAADGGGGILYGTQYFDARYSSADIGLSMAGGYGYGAYPDGQRVGGFGLVLYNGKDSPRFIGGAGGMLTGGQMRLGPFTVALDLLLGLGAGGATGWDGSGDTDGVMVAYGELDLSVGFTLSRWMQLVAYAGFQGMGSLFPGEPFRALSLYSPAIGVRLAWGRF